MKNAVYIFLFGGFIGTRVIAPDQMDALWQDPLFEDPHDDGIGWQFHGAVGGVVLDTTEEEGVAFAVRQRAQDSEAWEVLTTFPYANDGLLLRGDAYDALSKWVAQRVGFVEKVYEVVDLTHLKGSALDAVVAGE